MNYSRMQFVPYTFELYSCSTHDAIFFLIYYSLVTYSVWFAASKYLNKKMESKSDSKSTELISKESKKELLKKHRGSREMKEIEIETLSLNESKNCQESTSASGQVFSSINLKSNVNVKETSPESNSSAGATSSFTAANANAKLGSINQIQFLSGNHYIEVTKGILHLYKENKRTPLGEEAERSEMICILSVPNSMTIHDLLQFTSPVNENIEHIRVIRDNRPNIYMALIKFRNQKSSDEFYNNFNEISFNSIEPEICHLVYVAKLETTKESDDGCLPLANHTELPICPVCLERMDESVEGILTILCNHTFHSECLGKWGDTSCPVCRYSQTPELVEANHCFQCDSNESLWICLICGHIGCGRYVEGHAYQHYCETQHTYAMQLGLNNRVWDYAGDNYVHRLLQNKSDGKPVEVDCNQYNEEKIDSLKLEYTYLLTNQLDTQRHYFEETISRIETENTEQVKDIIGKNKLLEEQKDQIEKDLMTLNKEKQTLEKKVNQMSTKLKKALLDLQEEKEINKCLRENQELWSSKFKEQEGQLKELVERKQNEINDLKEQIQDFLGHFEAQDTLQRATSEGIESAQIVVNSSNTASTSSGSRRKAKAKKK